MLKFALSANQDHTKQVWVLAHHVLLPSQAALCVRAQPSAQPASKDTTSIRLEAPPHAFHASLPSMDAPHAKLTPLVLNATMAGTSIPAAVQHATPSKPVAWHVTQLIVSNVPDSTISVLPIAFSAAVPLIIASDAQLIIFAFIAWKDTSFLWQEQVLALPVIPNA